MKETFAHVFSSVNLGEAVCAMHLCPGINFQLTHQLYLSERKSWHGETVPAFVRWYAPRVCQSELNTDNDSSVTVEPHQVDSSWVELSREADRVGGSGNGSNHGRIRLELSRRRIIIVSWHRSVVLFPAHRFSFLVLLSLRFFRRLRIKLDDLCTKLAVHFRYLDSPNICPKGFRVSDKFEK